MKPASEVARHIAQQLRADPLAAAQVKNHFPDWELPKLLDIPNGYEVPRLEAEIDELNRELARA